MANPATRPDVSVVVPSHNEEDNLPQLVDEILAAEKASGRRFELVVIDDQSSDQSWKVLLKLAQKHPQIVARRMEKQSGQSAALSAGFDVAKGAIVVTMDADLQNDPADVPKLLEVIVSGAADCAIGWRRDRRDPLSKKVISKVANGVRNWMTAETVKDTGCGLKAFRRECLMKIARFNGMHRFFPTLVKMHGWTVAEIPVNHRPRTRGKTHYNIFNRFLRPMQDLLAVRWLQKRTLRYQLETEAGLLFASLLTPLNSVIAYWNGLTHVEQFWLVVGFSAQMMFTGRFVVQWIASEKKGMSYIPVSFWWLSVVGGGLLLCYAIYRRDPVYIMGQLTGQIVYTRNLILISRRCHLEKRDEAASIHAPIEMRKAA